MMETFAAAAVSLSISIALIFKRKKSHLHRSFAVLCFVLFFEKIGLFSYGILYTDFWKVIHYLGILSILPVLVIFCRYLLNKQAFLLKWDILLTCSVSLVIASALFTTPLFKWSYVNILLYFYIGLVLSYCFSALIRYIMLTSSHPEKKRMVYVAIACIIATTFGLFDVLHKYGYGVPPLSDIAIAGLLYFIFIIISHTDLPELYEIMLRTLLVLCVIIFATFVFIVVMLLFGETPRIPFTSVLMASFLIVILIDPIRMLLRKTFSYFFFDKKEFSASLYSIDDDVERKNFTLLEEMATGLAHEIRNPLGSIKGAAQLLKTEAHRIGNPKLLDIIIEETDRLNTVVSQFLNYAKPYVINAEKQNINHIIKKVISLIKTTNLPGNITIKENLATDLPDINIDGQQMIQVLLNIALNGIEAMPHGGMLTFTTSRIKNDGGRTVEITIRDTGRGITREDMKTIFNPFFTTKKKGTGLGLPICERIIKNHNGHIHVESTVDKGSAFYIRI